MSKGFESPDRSVIYETSFASRAGREKADSIDKLGNL